MSAPLARALAALIAFAAHGCESAIVGVSCQPGFTVCEGECVNLKADFRNCGACGHRCSRIFCYAGSCQEATAVQDQAATAGRSSDAGALTDAGDEVGATAADGGQ